MSGILINSWDIASVPCSCLSPASPEGLGLLLPVSRALWYTAFLKNPGIRMCHTLLWLWGTWHLLKVPGTHLLTLHTRNLNTHNIALNVLQHVASKLLYPRCLWSYCHLAREWIFSLSAARGGESIPMCRTVFIWSDECGRNAFESHPAPNSSLC